MFVVTCVICQKAFETERKNAKTCTKTCLRAYRKTIEAQAVKKCKETRAKNATRSTGGESPLFEIRVCACGGKFGYHPEPIGFEMDPRRCPDCANPGRMEVAGMFAGNLMGAGR